MESSIVSIQSMASGSIPVERETVELYDVVVRAEEGPAPDDDGAEGEPISSEQHVDSASEAAQPEPTSPEAPKDVELPRRGSVSELKVRFESGSVPRD